MKSKTLLILMAAVLGIAGGYVFRRVQHAPEPLAANSKLLSPDPLPKAPATNIRKPSALAAELAETLPLSQGVSRWLNWMLAVETATLADFAELARMAKGNTVMLKIIAARWIELDPRHLFETLLAANGQLDSSLPVDRLGPMLFEEWAKTDPAAAVAALSQKGTAASLLGSLRYSALNSVIKQDPELGLKALSDWSLFNFGVETSGIAKWAAKNPQHAAEFALAHPAGYGSQTALEVIGKEWAKQDPAAAMKFSAGLKDALGSALAASVLGNWAKTDIAAAATWLASAEPSSKARLAGPMIESWAKKDIKGALEWVAANLESYGRDEAVASLLKGAAETDLPAAASLVANMEASQARNKAAAEVAKKWFPTYAGNKPVPPEALVWLSNLDPAGIKQVVESVHWTWSSSDPESLRNFLTTPAGQHAPPSAYTTVARELIRQNPETALTWAETLKGSSKKMVESQIFSDWQYAHPTAMNAWFQKLPTGDPRIQSVYAALLGSYVMDQARIPALASSLATGDAAARKAVLEGLSLPPDKVAEVDKRLPVRVK